MLELLGVAVVYALLYSVLLRVTVLSTGCDHPRPIDMISWVVVVVD